MAGQPDKVCDQIADAIVDEYLRRDKDAHVDVNVMGSHGMIMVCGETNSTADFDIGGLVKNVYKKIGYTDEMEVFVNVESQSDEMKRAPRGVNDVVVINGYATSETRERLPRSVVFAHNIARRIDELRKTDPAFSWLRPDGKVQIIMDKAQVCGITILASHHLNIQNSQVQTSLLERVVDPIIGEDGTQIFINPIGSFVEVGFRADSGVSGHKTHVDTYGGLIPQGNSVLTGKSPLNAERCGAYMARFAAKYIVDQELASSALVNVVYTLGKVEPTHIHVLGMGEKSRGSKMDLTNLVKEKFDFRPEAIVERFGLLQPIYGQTSLYGHFGREGFPWEDVLN